LPKVLNQTGGVRGLFVADKVDNIQREGFLTICNLGSITVRN
jgi:hypothetical protein